MTGFVLFVIGCSFVITTAQSLKCNGFTELCELDITQVTLAGSHNSGAGYDGKLNYHTLLGRVNALSCAYRNQELSFTQQLTLGIRYFDIDACWQDDYEPKGAWICHEGAYAGSIEKMLQQIDDWMNEPSNRNEVIVIHFNRDFAKEDASKTGADIIQQLDGKWGSRVGGQKVSIQTDTYMKLKYAVTRNARIYIIMHTGLSQNYRKKWIIPQYAVGYTWTSMMFLLSGKCMKLIEAMGSTRCKEEAIHSFVRYDLYLSSGLCIDTMASFCKKYLTLGALKCFEGTLKRRSTVNFLVVDYVDSAVVKAATLMNKKNILYYLGKEI